MAKRDEYAAERREFESWFPMQFNGGEKLLGKDKNLEYDDQLVNAVWIGFVAGWGAK